jgi:uncharacterized membrane protein YcaP (DUF421 family)
VAEDISWIIEFERLARPRLQKIFEKDLVKLPVGLAECLEALRKKEASNRADAEAERIERNGELFVSKKPRLNSLTNCAVGCS